MNLQIVDLQLVAVKVFMHWNYFASSLELSQRKDLNVVPAVAKSFFFKILKNISKRFLDRKKIYLTNYCLVKFENK